MYFEWVLMGLMDFIFFIEFEFVQRCLMHLSLSKVFETFIRAYSLATYFVSNDYN